MDMSKTTKNIMRRVRKLLTEYGDLECCHCGFDERVKVADEKAYELLCYVEDQVEALAVKGGAE